MNRFSWWTMMIVLFLSIVIILGYRHWFGCRILARYPDNDGAMIEIVEPDYKEGLPHTSDANTIRMTAEIYHGPRRDEILRHERVHIAQRRSPTRWAEFYASAWGYTLHTQPPEGLPASLRLRPNPDTADSPYVCWQRRYWMFPAYTSNGTLKDAEVVVWDSQTRRRVSYPAKWRAFFCGSRGCPHQWEHPHELSAEYVTLGSDCPAAKKLFAWLK